jgi:hypothetical protein
MRVLNLGVFDGILGIDWLESYSSMQCDWVQKTMSFSYQGKQIELQGDSSKMQAVSLVQALQVQRWIKGNEIWVCVLMEPTDTEKRQQGE